MTTTTQAISRSAEAFSKLTGLIPRGLTSSMRARRSNLLFSRGEGGILFDLDGKAYVDCVLGFGPIVIGHNEPAVNERLHEQIDTVVVTGAESEGAIELIERLRKWIPCAERVTFVSTGSEAVHMALRIARATTGRSKVLRFEGHYHGWIDPAYTNGMTLGPVGNDVDPIPVRPNGEGQLDLGDQIVVARWNDIAAFDRAITDHGDQLAAVIMEPIAFNSGGARPYTGYLEHVRKVCTDRGIILIFDEVVCGFRLGRGGAQELLGVTPDMATFAKALASGIPVAMIAGTEAAMASLQDGRLSAAGTYNGNALSIAAANVTTKFIDETPTFYEELEEKGAWLRSQLEGVAQNLQVPVSVNQVGSVLCLFWDASGDRQTFESCASGDPSKVQAITEGMAEHGVFALPRGTFFLCYRHTRTDLEQVVTAFRLSIEGLLAGRAR